MALKRLLDRSLSDLVVLDIMMLAEDGFACLSAGSQHRRHSIIFLTAMTDDIDRIVSLEVGAADYQTKPLNPRELPARFKAVLRRVNSRPLQRRKEFRKPLPPPALGRLPFRTTFSKSDQNLGSVSRYEDCN
ncbi:response regulator [Chelativorans salis]|uniref:response regulator n=1 Tax=Chelativorans salis TaxID=2978478 RepID=UPI0028CBA480|nr:response regulator [Chelativorans sp. EGI FJ00035]